LILDSPDIEAAALGFRCRVLLEPLGSEHQPRRIPYDSVMQAGLIMAAHTVGTALSRSSDLGRHRAALGRVVSHPALRLGQR
jgi:hypothetical protein